MDLPIIMSRFAEFSALSGEELAACQSLCRDAEKELADRCLTDGAGAEQLCSAPAALAYYRLCLLQMSGSSVPHLGHTALATKETLAAAKQLRDEYLLAASPYLRSEQFHFGQVTV